MTNNVSHDVSYEPPTKKFIENSLLYGLLSEDETESTFTPPQRLSNGYSDLGLILQNKSGIERRMIQFAFDNKRKIKNIPWLGKIALSIKKYLIRKNLDKISYGGSRIDLSGIMLLEINDFIWQLYMLALGRPPDDEGWSNTKHLLCSGAPKEAVAYMICTSKEFANRAQVAYLSEYQKVYWNYRIRKGFQRLPLVGIIWAIAAIPRRIYRLEIEERIRNADLQLIERQRFEALTASLNSSQNRLEALDSENADLRSDFNNLHSQNKSLQTQVNALNTEINIGFDSFQNHFEALYSENADLRQIINDLLSQNKILQAQVKEVNSETQAALQIANQNIIHANVKLDETGILINDTANRNKPVFFSLAGAVTAVQTKDYIIGVPSEEWRLAVFLSMNGFFELGTEKYFRSILKEGLNVIDVGAYLGIYTLHALAAGCCVYSYEPTPKICDILVDNVGVNGFEPTHRAHIYNLAVSDAEDKAKFSIIGNGVGQMNSLFAVNPDDKTIEVKTVNLDKHLVQLGHVDVVKIDAEGAEPQVMRGMAGIIEKNSGIKIIMEFAPAHLKRGGKEPLEFINDIRSMDLDIHLIHEESGEILDISDEALSEVFSVNVLLTRLS
jgi:FkbM family methyltransferase